MDAHRFANDWIASWNSHNMDAIMDHYSDDIEITTPMIKLAADIESGSLKGREQVRAYWQKALERIPDLHFELYEVTAGVDCVSLYYKSVMGKKAIETMFFDAKGKVCRMVACYTA